MNPKKLGTLSRKNILVVGANSFLARVIIEKTAALNRLTGVYHVDRSNSVPEVEYISVQDIGRLHDEFEVVFIIAAFIPDERHQPDLEKLEIVNVKLPELVCAKFKNARIIYASSVSVYGLLGGKFHERSLLRPTTPYGSSKLTGENIIRTHPSYASIRISSMYGPGMKPYTFLPRIVQQALRNKRISLWGTGKRLQNYIHVRDVAEIFIRASLRESNDTYLAVAEHSINNHDVASLVSRLTGGTPIVIEGTDDSPSFEYHADFTYRELDYKPQNCLRDGIKELITWQEGM